MKARKKSGDNTLKILLVEDVEGDARPIIETLEGEGYKVLFAKNGAEGLALAKNERPRIILSDILMPVLDGYRMCVAIKKDIDLKNTPVILLTALSSPQDFIQALECGADHFIIKPYEKKVLKEKISNLLSNLELQAKPNSRDKTEVALAGQHLIVNANQRQILDLLISSVENILTQNRELAQAQGELKVLNQQLETKVEERTRAFLQSQERLVFLAHHDGLTGLPNRVLLMDRLVQALTRITWQHRYVAVLFLDLDHFKRINDTLKHNVGDLLLKAVAERLSFCVRRGDTVGRLGGDEFVVILTDMARGQDAYKVAEKIIDELSKPFPIDGHELYTTPSIGISIYPDDGEDAETLLKNADAAMYRAKDEGRNNYQHYSPAMNAQAFEQLALGNSLRKALEREELILNYHPRVDLATGDIIGVEALLRWQHPDLGLVSPARFIPLAEETGLIVPIGEWVLRTACAQVRTWRKAYGTPLRVAVNISGRQFQQPNLVQSVDRALKDSGLEGNGLELELTESILMRKEKAVAQTLGELRDMGVEISIDDFGTGYSSLGYLKSFPIHLLKVDQSFVRDITSDMSSAAIVAAIITLGHTLSLKVVAEGVETKEQLEFLREHHCDAMQGYLFSRPLSSDGMAELLSQKKRL